MIALGKILQAIGIAETLIGLIAGLQGSTKNEIIFASVGVIIFVIGRQIEKIRWKNKAKL
jgi:Na+/H+ antiporter NhaC